MMCVNTNSQVLNLPIEDVIPNRFQPRLKFDEQALNDLAVSIKQHGIIQPLVVRKTGGKYEIIAGERRYKAAKMAGLTSVPAIITEMDDKESAEFAVVENVQRKALNPIEEAKSFKTLLDKGITQEQLAKRMGLSEQAIDSKLRLLNLTNSVQDALMDGQISERHARSLLQLNTEEQEKWLKVILDERLTVKELDDRIKRKGKMENTIDVMQPPVELNDVLSTENKEVNINNNEVKEINNANISLNNNDLGIEEKPIPNKFFNFLEDEQANMKTDGLKKESSFNDSVEMLNYVPEHPVIFPNNEVQENNIEEVNNVNEISVPSIDEALNNLGLISPVVEEKSENNEKEETIVTEKEEKENKDSNINENNYDIDLAIELVDKLKKELRKNNYSLIFTEEEDSKELKYIITIRKEKKEE